LFKKEEKRSPSALREYLYKNTWKQKALQKNIGLVPNVQTRHMKHSE
jgi:hypothetical protein